MAARRDRLAQRRKTVGYTQETLAEKLGVDVTTVRRWETGETETGPQPWMRPKLARCLQVSVDELEELLNNNPEDPQTQESSTGSVQPQSNNGYGDTERLNLDSSAEPRRDPAAPTQNTAPILPSLRWASNPAEAEQAAVTLWEYELENCPSDAVDTTELSLLTLHWLVAPPDSSVFRGTGVYRVGLGDVQRVRDIRCQLKALDDRNGGGTAFPMAITYLRREVGPLLRGRYDDATGHILVSAIAELMLDLGWMAYDAGTYALAWRYMVQALRLSHAVENRLFGGRVLAAMSHHALHLQYVPLAVDLIRAAREGTKHIAPPKVQAMLAAMEACAQAACQQVAACTTALHDAETALARASSDDPDWLDFDQGGLSGHAARALRDLRHSREAEHHAVASLTLCHDGHSRTRAQRNTILATTQFQLGEVEAAAATGLLVISDAWRLRSGRVHSELAALVHTIESIGSTATKDFIDQGREFLATRVR